MNYQKILNLVNFLHNLLLSKFNELFKNLSKPENLIFYFYILLISFLLLMVAFIHINYELIQLREIMQGKTKFIVNAFSGISSALEMRAGLEDALKIQSIENEILKDALQQSKDRYFYLDSWCIVLLVVALYFSS